MSDFAKMHTVGLPLVAFIAFIALTGKWLQPAFAKAGIAIDAFQKSDVKQPMHLRQPW
jgi:hypothetical protein